MKSPTFDSKEKILIIDDEPKLGWIFSKVLGEGDFCVISAFTGKEGIKKFRRIKPHLVFLDLKLPDKDGIEVLGKLKDINPQATVIMITAFETIESTVKAMKLGAYDYIPKPIPTNRLKIIVDKALELQSLSREVKRLQKQAAPLGNIVGQSSAINKVYKLIRNVASYEVSVIIRGESGTGKELVAKAIHSASKRKNANFVAVDCATLPETLVESELFGFQKGAFTGADYSKAGKFESADQGTIFLDEIGNLSAHIQIKLLRVLQERKVERLGAKDPKKVDIRILSATNRDLEKEVEIGNFREDLFHRLNVFEITLPPLREREGDITLLSHYFLDKFSKEMKKEIKGFSEEVLKLFNTYQWPGNVRELENSVKSSIILAKDEILPDHLFSRIRKASQSPGEGNDKPGQALNSGISLRDLTKGATKQLQKDMIKQALAKTDGNKTKAAKLLKIDRMTLYSKIKQFQLD